MRFEDRSPLSPDIGERSPLSPDLEDRSPLQPDAGFLVEIDGSSLRNPGPAGVGVRIAGPGGSVRKEISRSIGIRTNNQAEYEAFILALEECRELNGRPVVIRTDSELLYHQMAGRYRVKNPELKLLHDKAQRLKSQLPEVVLELVRREQNRRTDKLAKAAARAAGNESRGQESSPTRRRSEEGGTRKEEQSRGQESSPTRRRSEEGETRKEEQSRGQESSPTRRVRR